MTGKKQKTVLIVEDEPIHLRVLADTFTNEGFRVLSAKNGEEGLEFAFRERPDTILLDRVMPIMDGMTMMEKLRKEGHWGKNVPIILLTNVPIDEETKNTVTGDKLVDYMVKSDWALGDVVAKARKILS